MSLDLATILGADLAVIAPLVVVVLVAAAIIAADIVAPGNATVAVGVGLPGARGRGGPDRRGRGHPRDRVRRLVPGRRPDDLPRPRCSWRSWPSRSSSGRTTCVPRGLPVAEFAAILVFAIAGAMLVAAAADLLVLFLGLELMVLPGYLLAGYAKRDALSTEGAIKYFLLGSFSSAIFLFGLAFVWGLTGSTSIAVVAAAAGQDRGRARRRSRRAWPWASPS